MLLLTFLLIAFTQGLEITTVGRFSNCQPSDCSFSYANHQVRWAKSTGSGRSGLGYTDVTANFTLDPLEEPQLIGILEHYNWPVTGDVPQTVDLSLNLTRTTEILTQLKFTLDIHETPNEQTPLINGTCIYPNEENLLCCPYYTPEIPCSDRIRFITRVDVNKTFVLNETSYTLKVDGFFDNDEIVESFITQEGTVSTGFLFGRVVQTCAFDCVSQDPCIYGECVKGVCEFSSIFSCYCFEDPQVCKAQDCFWCGSCSEEPCSSDDDDLPAIIGGTVAACCCCCLLGLLALGLMGLLTIPFLPKVKQILTSSGVLSANETLHGAHTNPLHKPKFTEHHNPLSD